MSELRAPDPTLTALTARQLVYVSNDPISMVSTAHRQDPEGRRCAGVAFLLFAGHARWFAVPCRECFPEAPEPGHRFDVDGEDPSMTDEVVVPDLLWQVSP